MVTRDEAIGKAREWLATGGQPNDVEIGVDEFDLGYILWPVQPRGATDRPPAALGGARAVVDRETGELSVWPMLPTPVIAEQYRETRRAKDRFPPQVYADLEAAGWRPGRNVAASVDEWLARTGIDRELPIFPAARAALDEFGGLTIPRRGPTGLPGRGFPSSLYPGKYAPTTPEIREFAGIIGHPVFPVGDHADGPSHLVIDDLGRVFLLHPMDDVAVGDTMDAALVWMVLGGDRPVVGPDGRW